MKIVYNEENNTLSLAEVPDDYTSDNHTLDLLASREELKKIPMDKLSEHSIQIFCYGLWPNPDVDKIESFYGGSSTPDILARSWVFNPTDEPLTQESFVPGFRYFCRRDGGWVKIDQFQFEYYRDQERFGLPVACAYFDSLENYISAFFSWNIDKLLGII